MRKPAVSGSFYPGSKGELISTLEKYIESGADKATSLGVISPHAGYIYSGKTAGKVFSRVKIPDSVLILCPNHTGLGAPFSIWPAGNWLTPLGEIHLDTNLTQTLLKSSRLLSPEPMAHSREHSAEVQLPFLQYLNSNVEIAVICIGAHNFDNLVQLGIDIYEAIKSLNKDILLLVSSDMTHYESDEKAREKDRLAINAIEKLDAQLLFDNVRKFDITMCGYAPTITAITAVKKLGATKGITVDYSTSGEVNNDYTQVVGYAGIILN